MIAKAATQPTTAVVQPPTKSAAPMTPAKVVAEPERQTLGTNAATPAEAPAETTTADAENAQPAEPATTNSAPIQGSYKEHYGKTKEEIAAENAKILETQKKCMDFVKEHQNHPAICEWCQKEYQKP